MLRLSTVEKRPDTDVSALDASILDGIKLSFSITTKQSKDAGGETPVNTSLILPSAITQFSLDAGGQSQLSKDSTDGFVQLDGTVLEISSDAAVGAAARIGIKQAGGTKTLVIVKKTADTIVVTYQG